MEKNFVEVRPYDGDIYRIDTAGEASAYGNHGGGDAGLMHELFLALNGEEAEGISFIDVSAESHHMALRPSAPGWRTENLSISNKGFSVDKVVKIC